MKKLLPAVFVLFFCSVAFGQDIQSPEAFLGYKTGTQFTPHHKLVGYFKAMAAAKPGMMKLEQYGSTYEGRPLLLAYISLPENIQRLDAIRMNNLRMAGVAKDKMAPVTDNMPAIVWLSYNVHGNEPASSEASMLTLYALLDEKNTQSKEWLKNTVVIIDPCLNPDGRDRYVNWYNTSVGTNFNASGISIEHAEPWPYGRTNHYNFDLNRDWAWQTQKESVERIKKYNEWLPQVHVDFHEQGYETPYYFAPAAEPYHEVITQWQRDFQVQIGRNNARYFDEKGWLYFTRERFDLLYPSYGDTYPTYNGSIGMTYEQGGIGAGLGIVLRDGDTLTLVDRALHHFTTGISTIEVSAKNAGKLITEFKKYFDDARNATGLDYKTYVLTSNDANKIQTVADELSAMGIEYGVTANNNFRGLNYFTGKEEAYSDEGFQLAVSCYQPKSRLIKVLFEQNTFVSDSATYDITAWSIPFAHGVKGYSVKEKLDINAFKKAADVTDVQTDYGLLIPYKSMNAVQVMTKLLNQKIRLRYSDKPFSYKGKNYDRGTLIVLKGGNRPDWQAITMQACKEFNIQPDAVGSGFVDKGADFGSPDVKYIKPPRVALAAGANISNTASGEVWSLFEQTLHYPVSRIDVKNLERISIDDFDVLIMPDGNYNMLNDKNNAERLQGFVSKGGRIIALENAAVKIASLEWGFKLKQSDDSSKDAADYALLKKYAEREHDALKGFNPGSIYRVELDNTHPLAYGYPNYYYTLKQDGNLYEFLKTGWNVGVVKKASYAAGFTGSTLKSEIKDGLLFGVQEYNDGNVVILTDDVLFRLFWQNGKQLFCNAVFLVGQ